MTRATGWRKGVEIDSEAGPAEGAGSLSIQGKAGFTPAPHWWLGLGSEDAPARILRRARQVAQLRRRELRHRRGW
jgi:hypothetical protein